MGKQWERSLSSGTTIATTALKSSIGSPVEAETGSGLSIDELTTSSGCMNFLNRLRLVYLSLILPTGFLAKASWYRSRFILLTFGSNCHQTWTKKYCNSKRKTIFQNCINSREYSRFECTKFLRKIVQTVSFNLVCESFIDTRVFFIYLVDRISSQSFVVSFCINALLD